MRTGTRAARTANPKRYALKSLSFPDTYQTLGAARATHNSAASTAASLAGRRHNAGTKVSTAFAPNSVRGRHVTSVVSTARTASHCVPTTTATLTKIGRFHRFPFAAPSISANANSTSAGSGCLLFGQFPVAK